MQRVSLNDETSNYVINLPKSGWSLEVRAMTGADEQMIQKSVKQRRMGSFRELDITL